MQLNIDCIKCMAFNIKETTVKMCQTSRLISQDLLMSAIFPKTKTVFSRDNILPEKSRKMEEENVFILFFVQKYNSSQGDSDVFQQETQCPRQ